MMKTRYCLAALIATFALFPDERADKLFAPIVSGATHAARKSAAWR